MNSKFSYINRHHNNRVYAEHVAYMQSYMYKSTYYSNFILSTNVCSRVPSDENKFQINYTCISNRL